MGQRKGYRQTKEHSRRISVTRKENYKKGLYDYGFREGHIPWNKGKKGLYKHSEEIRKIISLSKIGDKNPMKRLEVRNKMSRSSKGKIISPEHRRKIAESMDGKHSGKDNPMYGKSGELCPTWLGGKSFEPYDEKFNNKFKRAIRKRDNYVCLKCGKHQEKESGSLSVHHINYLKELTIPENCCALCRSCNSEVNWKRKHYTRFFQSLLSEKYGYQYSKDGEIILTAKQRFL